jgi:hypothetical protein
LDGDQRAVAAHKVPGAGDDGLDEQRAGAEIAACLSERPVRLREADDGQRPVMPRLMLNFHEAALRWRLACASSAARRLGSCRFPASHNSSNCWF